MNSSWDHTRSTFSEFHIKPNQSRDCVRTNCLTFSFSGIAVDQKYCDISPVTGGGRKGWYSYRISDWEWLGLSGWLVCKIQDNGIAGKLRTIARKTKKQLSYSYQRKIHLRCSSLRSNERKIFSAFIARKQTNRQIMVGFTSRSNHMRITKHKRTNGQTYIRLTTKSWASEPLVSSLGRLSVILVFLSPFLNGWSLFRSRPNRVTHIPWRLSSRPYSYLLFWSAFGIYKLALSLVSQLPNASTVFGLLHFRLDAIENQI